MDRIAIAFAALVLASCTGSVESTKTVRDYEIQRLFETDGCVMHRFADNGDWHYFLTCKDRAETISNECRMVGKTAICKEDIIQTVWAAE